MSAPLLEVKDLTMHFPIRSRGLIPRTIGHVPAVDGVSFTIEAGQALGLVGESGSGKSTTGRLVTRLHQPTSGEIIFDGQDISKWSARQLKPLRRDIQMIFQDPYTSLNPRHTVGEIISAPLEIHNLVPKNGRLKRVQELLEIVGLNPEHYNRYPHEFSGGQRQRIGIARALAVGPEFIVCDEPVSALDVSIQAQIINLLLKLQDELGLAYLFISHDLRVVRHMSHRVAVMYLGQIVEQAPVADLYERPRHPYTRALLDAAPSLEPGVQRKKLQVHGELPSPFDPPSGCSFHPRCDRMQKGKCDVDSPILDRLEPQHKVACFFPLD